MPGDVEQEQLTKDLVLAKIPAFPPIVLRVLDLLCDENVEIARLVELIASDAAFSAQTLRVANSPLFGFRSEIDTVQHAVVALGLSRVQSLTMAVATSNYMRAALKIEELHRCWRHTLASAIVCRELARAARFAEDRAYTVGLLHDIGRIGMLVAYPNEYASMLKAADREQLSLLDQERRQFGMDHCEAGRCLVEQWHLPADFCVVAGRHHDRPSGNELDLLTLAYLGCHFADALGYWVLQPLEPPSFAELRAMLPTVAQPRFPDRPEAVQEIVERTIRMHDLASSVKTRTPKPSDTYPVGSPANSATAEARDESPAPEPWTEPETMFRPGSAGWELRVISVSALIFALVLLASYLLWTSQPG